MKVYNLTSRKVEAYEDGYAARLIEQGKAILPEKPKAAAAKAEPANQPEPEETKGAGGPAKGKAASGKTGGK